MSGVELERGGVELGRGGVEAEGGGVELQRGAIAAPVRRVRKAYEQVYDQLRELIVGGQLARDQRLPNEAVLAREFGVSRGTVREALRLLAAHGLIRTAKGAGGGSFVTLPTVDHLSRFLQANLSLLNESHDVSAEEMLEARELLESFAARMAALRRSPADLARLRSCIIDDPAQLGSEQQFAYNAGFHTGLLDASGNTLLALAAQPIFGILQTNMRRREIAVQTLRRVNEDHRAILVAVEDGDPDAAEERMREHLAMLRETYVRLWTRHGRQHRPDSGASVGD
jgi:GntR family transcriptional repressor for pyruvate dehydrogenase complex